MFVMKKILLSALSFLPAFLFSQTPIFSENFDSYSSGAFAAVSSPYMSTWTNTPGGSDDCLITNNDYSSASNSIVITGPQAGGDIDAMVVFPSNYTTGRYEFSMKYKVAAGKGGYFNIQSNGTSPGTAWLAEVYFAADGSGSAQAGGQSLSFTYSNGSWIDVSCELDLDSDMGHLIIDGFEVGTGFTISVEADGAGTGANKSFGGINLYSASGDAVADCEYYVDDLSLVQTTGVGISETTLEPSISIYPNPSSGNFVVKFDDMSMENANVVLVDVLGNVVYNEKMNVLGTGIIPFNLNLRNGAYFVTVSTNEVKMTKKVIIRK